MNSKGETELEPPWITMPDYPMISMAWKMGSGELVSWKFQIRYRALSKVLKRIFAVNSRNQRAGKDTTLSFYLALISILDTSSNGRIVIVKPIDLGLLRRGVKFDHVIFIQATPFCRSAHKVSYDWF